MWNILSQPQEMLCPIAKKIVEAKFLGFQYQSWHPVLCIMAFLFLLFLHCRLSGFQPLAVFACFWSLPHSFPQWQIKLRTLLENSHPTS